MTTMSWRQVVEVRSFVVGQFFALTFMVPGGRNPNDLGSADAHLKTAELVKTAELFFKR